MPRHLTLMLLVLQLLWAASAHALGSLPPDHPTYRAVRGVYDRVARAFGDGRIPPRLMVVPKGEAGRNAVAWSDPGTEGAIGIESEAVALREGYIAVEERVWELFASLGEERESALAFLLGHELTHYYLRHGWVGDFGNSFASLEMGRKMIKAASYEEVIKRETEADYLGGFYGRLAGYDTLGAAPRALDLIYATYKLPDALRNYPSRQERRAIAERSAANLKKMVPVFSAATRLLLLERYEEAARLFQHLAHSFPSREMFNNAGVAYTLEALRLSRAPEAGFLYPLEFDAETRLKGKGGRSKGMPNEGAQQSARLLQQAAECFDKAVQRDKGYAAGYLNLAVVDTLLGDHDNGVLLANRAMELARRENDQQTVSGALVARGIAYAQGGNRDKALVDMAAARNLGSAAAAHNLARLQGEAAKRPAGKGGEIESQLRETVAGSEARANFVIDQETASFSLKGVEREEPTLTVHSRAGKGWENTVVSIGARLVRFLAAGPGYPQLTARGIGIGSGLGEVLGAYGEPSRIMSSRQENYYLYQKSGLVFSLGPDGKVAGWMIYAVQ